MTYVLDSKLFAVTGGEFGGEASAISLVGYIIVAGMALCYDPVRKESRSGAFNVENRTPRADALGRFALISQFMKNRLPVFKGAVPENVFQNITRRGGILPPPGCSGGRRSRR